MPPTIVGGIILLLLSACPNLVCPTPSQLNDGSQASTNDNYKWWDECKGVFEGTLSYRVIGPCT